jgi:hypothetical protein
MNWKQAAVTAVITMLFIFLFKQIAKKVNIPVAGQIIQEV